MKAKYRAKVKGDEYINYRGAPRYVEGYYYRDREVDYIMTRDESYRIVPETLRQLVKIIDGKEYYEGDIYHDAWTDEDYVVELKAVRRRVKCRNIPSA